MSENEARWGWLITLAQTAAWIVTAAGALIDMLGLREMILSFLALFKVINQEAFRRKGGVGEDIFTNFGIAAFDNVMLLILGLATIAAVVMIDNYFRKGRLKGELFKRIGIVLGGEVAIIILVLIIRQVIGNILVARG